MDQPSLPTKWQHSVLHRHAQKRKSKRGHCTSLIALMGAKTLFRGTSLIATGLQTLQAAYQNELVLGHVYEYMLTLGRIQFHNSALQDLPRPRPPYLFRAEHSPTTSGPEFQVSLAHNPSRSPSLGCPRTRSGGFSFGGMCCSLG